MFFDSGVARKRREVGNGYTGSWVSGRIDRIDPSIGYFFVGDETAREELGRASHRLLSWMFGLFWLDGILKARLLGSA